jgi:hypothetical protein
MAAARALRSGDNFDAVVIGIASFLGCGLLIVWIKPANSAGLILAPGESRAPLERMFSAVGAIWIAAGANAIGANIMQWEDMKAACGIGHRRVASGRAIEAGEKVVCRLSDFQCDSHDISASCLLGPL